MGGLVVGVVAGRGVVVEGVDGVDPVIVSEREGRWGYHARRAAMLVLLLRLT